MYILSNKQRVLFCYCCVNKIWHLSSSVLSLVKMSKTLHILVNKQKDGKGRKGRFRFTRKHKFTNIYPLSFHSEGLIFFLFMVDNSLIPLTLIQIPILTSSFARNQNLPSFWQESTIDCMPFFPSLYLFCLWLYYCCRNIIYEYHLLHLFESIF